MYGAPGVWVDCRSRGQLKTLRVKYHEGSSMNTYGLAGWYKKLQVGFQMFISKNISKYIKSFLRFSVYKLRIINTSSFSFVVSLLFWIFSKASYEKLYVNYCAVLKNGGMTELNGAAISK